MTDIWCIVNGNNGNPGIPCDINVIDLQACYLGDVSDGEGLPPPIRERFSGYSTARAFLCENGFHSVNHVYAWKGKSLYAFGYNRTSPGEFFNREAGYYSFSLDCPEGAYIGRSVAYTAHYDY